ncbi:MAG: carbohydrate ABC transporter permease [Bacteroidota bacterium]
MKDKSRLITYPALCVFLVFLLFPLYWMLCTSFKTNLVIYKVPPEWYPHLPTLANYARLFREGAFIGYYLNNFIASFLATALTVILAVLSGYSLSRFKFRGSNLLMLLLLSTQMFPLIGIVIALYTVFRSMSLLNTMTGLVLALSAAALPFCVWLIKGFFDSVPISLEEAAAIDGCGRLGTLARVVLPLSKPGLLAIGTYAFLLSWDDFLYCLTLITKDNLRTLSVGIALRYLGELSYDWATVMTISVIGTLPMLLLFVFFQGYMVQGLTGGSIKG